MGATRNLSHQLVRHWESGQYPMFVTGSELSGLLENEQLHSDEADWAGGVDELRRSKLFDAVNPHYHRPPGTLSEDIERHGVRSPLEIDLSDEQPELHEGHHRAFVAEDIERRTGTPVWLPVAYDRT